MTSKSAWPRVGRRVLLAGLLMLSVVWPAHGGTIRHDRDDSLYLALAADTAFDPVGKFTWNEPGFSYLASGTLIRDDWVLTAGHVVGGTDNMGGGISNFRFNIGGTNYTADNWIPHEQWTATGGEDNLTAGWDIGLVHLANAVSGIPPAELYLPSDGSELGLAGTEVGYGATGTGSTGYQSGTSGTKRAGQNILDVVGTAETASTPNLYNHERLIAVDFDNAGGGFGNNPFGSGTPLDLEYLIAPGDSGGGLFLDVGGEMKLAGVTSYLFSFDLNGANADYGDRAGFTRVSQFVDWINDTIEAAEPILLPGDYNNDGVVNAADYTVWRNNKGLSVTLPGDETPGSVDQGDYLVWWNHYGEVSGGGSVGAAPPPLSVPEPSGLLLASLALAGWLPFRWSSLRRKRTFDAKRYSRRIHEKFTPLAAAISW